jgi:4-amino-4-deoxy-L-arabinose transferase-like glycosyltransferase
MKTQRIAKRSILLLCIILIALSLRVTFLALTTDLEPIYDEYAYVRMAREILADGDFGASWLWPPGQPYFMAGVFFIVGENLVAVKAVQVILSTLSVYLIFLITRRIFKSTTAALLAAGIAAIYPNLIAFSHYLWSETLFIFFLLCFIHSLLLFSASNRYRFLVASGILFSMGCLTRPVLLPCLAIVFLYLWGRLRTKPRVLAITAVTFAVTVAAVLTPWVLRNHRVHGGWMVIAPTGHHLWRGNSGILRPDSEEDAFSRERYEACGPSSLERDRYAFAKAAELIRAGQPFWILEKSALYLRTWRVDRSFILRHIEQGLYGEISQSVEGVLTACIRYIYLAMMIGAIVGLVWTPYRIEKWFLVGLLLSFSAVYVVSISRNVRLRLPLEALLIMFSAEGYILLGGLVRRLGRRATPVISGKTIFLAALFCFAMGLFIYNSHVDIVGIARRALP